MPVFLLAVEPLILEYFENNDTNEVLYTLQVNKVMPILKGGHYDYYLKLNLTYSSCNYYRSLRTFWWTLDRDAGWLWPSASSWPWTTSRRTGNWLQFSSPTCIWKWSLRETSAKVKFIIVLLLHCQFVNGLLDGSFQHLTTCCTSYLTWSWTLRMHRRSWATSWPGLSPTTVSRPSFSTGNYFLTTRLTNF